MSTTIAPLAYCPSLTRYERWKTRAVRIGDIASAFPYLDRYAEPDKARSGLGTALESWPVPYWWVDAGMSVEAALIAASGAGLGACFFGLFEHERAVASRFGVALDWRAAGTIALGTPGTSGHRRSRSAARGRESSAAVTFWNRWDSGELLANPEL